MSPNRERNDRKPRNSPRRAKERETPPRKGAGEIKTGTYRPELDRESGRGGGPSRARRSKPAPENLIWGRHAVLAAIENGAREPGGQLWLSAERARELEGHIDPARRLRVEIRDGHDIARALPQGAVHQGMVLVGPPLASVSLDDIADPAQGVLIMLDQITDPQNVGAIFRSGLAMGAKGIIVQDRHAPELSGALAKAAAGAIERLPCARVTNLSRALEQLSDLGWRAVGLDSQGTETLEEALDARPTVIVMGSEGDGIRRLVAEHCDALARIPMPGGFESLNVSNAAAIALYEAARNQKR